MLRESTLTNMTAHLLLAIASLCGCVGNVRLTTDAAVDGSPASGSDGGGAPGRDGGEPRAQDGDDGSSANPGDADGVGGNDAAGADAAALDRDAGAPGRDADPGPVLLPDGGFVETFDTSAPTSSRNGPLAIERFSVVRWRQTWSPSGTPDTRGFGPEPPGDIRIAQGRLTVECGMQEYGDTLVRVNQPFAGTRIEFDGQLVSLQGEPQLLLTDRPYTTPSFNGENGEGPHMDNGIAFFWKANGCPMMRRWVNGVQTNHFGDGSSEPGPYTCLGSIPAVGAGVMNHVVIELSSTGITVSTDGSLTGRYPASPIANGYVMFGTHNHATNKYSQAATNNSVWDRLSWNGPVLAPSRVAQVPNAAGHFFGWPLPGSAGTQLTTTPLSLAGATQAWLLLDVGVFTASVELGAMLQFQLNNKSVRAASWQYDNRTPGRLPTSTFSVPLELSDLVEGPNNVRLFSATLSSLQPFFANVDIVVR
jgi:hypothetical protein